MKSSKRKRLQAPGWKGGDARSFLGLSDEEAALVEMKLALAGHLRQRRRARHVSQVELADQFGSSQSRVAKMEAADGSVSLDLLVRAQGPGRGAGGSFPPPTPARALYPGLRVRP